LTDDLDNRLKVHNQGGSPHTSKCRPWRRIASIRLEDDARAVEFERYLKTGSGCAFANRRFWGETAWGTDPAGPAGGTPDSVDCRPGAKLYLTYVNGFVKEISGFKKKKQIRDPHGPEKPSPLVLLGGGEG
jgi:hypothetical protein